MMETESMFSDENLLYKQLCMAIKNNDLAKLQSLKQQPITADFNLCQQSLLHFAALTSANVEIIQYLIDQGLDVNKFDIYYQTPLCLALTSGQRVILDLFKLRNIDLDTPDFVDLLNSIGILPYAKHQTPLKNEKYQVIECLVKNGAKIFADTNNLHLSELHIAIYYGDLNLLKLFLKHGYNIDQEIKGLGTPLTLAILMNNFPIVEYLLKNGANPLKSIFKLINGKPKYMLPIDIAIHTNHTHFLPFLVEYMVKENSKSLLKIFIDSFFFNFEIFYGNYHGEHGTLFLSLYEETLQYILNYEIDVNEKDEDGNALIHYVILNLYGPESLKLILKFGADIYTKDREGNTPLHLAIQRDCSNFFPIITEYMPNILERNTDGEAPVDYDDDNLITKYVIFYRLLFNQNINFRYSKKLKESTQAEIELLKKTKIEDSNIYSLYDILTLPVHKLICCARNENIVNYFKENEFVNLKVYGVMLKNHFNNIQIRCQLIQSGIEAFRALGQNDLPDFIIEEICHFLSNDDLRILIKVYKSLLNDKT